MPNLMPNLRAFQALLVECGGHKHFYMVLKRDEDLGLLDVSGGVGLCLLFLHGGGKVGLVSCDGASRRGGGSQYL